MAGKTILLIEDNPSDIELARRAFGKSRLMVAEDGEEALDYLWGRGRHAERDATDLPALTLLDLKLPGVSGLEVLHRIRENEKTRRIPVVILSSSSEESDIAAAYDLGANSYIRKPVDFQKFTRSVEQLVTYWLRLNEPPPAAG
ncbi:MAG TPA: response regulator [Bryobacteraceae bacterium]|nr:response regulator [Bryobacteraceae bacterium]